MPKEKTEQFSAKEFEEGYSKSPSFESSTEHEASDRERLTSSPSVDTVWKVLTGEPVSAAAFAQKIFDIHTEYASGTAASMRLADTPTKRLAQDWLDEIQPLFDPVRIRELTNRPPVLHGRLVVIGLCLLEPQLRQQLEVVGAFEMLVKELNEPLLKILTDKGRGLLPKPGEPPIKPDQLDKEPGLPDSVPVWGDDPLYRLGDDLLGRAGFARFLVKRIATIPPDSGAYVMLLYGPWGSGKSTLLNFMHNELENLDFMKGEKWLVVDFNAWRNQHIQPAWWSLMERVFQMTKDELSWRDKLHQYWWRSGTGHIPYIVSVVALTWILALIVIPLLGKMTPEKSILSYLSTFAKDISNIVALIVTIWGAILAINRSLFLSSARAARRYTELTHDPTEKIKEHFKELVNELKPKRVAVFIDDLDRCQSNYVVRLLEGIQTFFREAPVVFVVVADRRWLNACYEQVYEKLKPRVSEPGKPLGTLFLEKAFRFSAPIPGIPEELKQKYWLHLLQVKPAEMKADLDQARDRAKEKISKAKSEGEVQRMVESSREAPFSERRAIREEAALKLAAPEILERLEHTLTPYAELLETNPRSMKLLVNLYSANRALSFLSEIEIGQHQLVLWTILSSRWPHLASYLEKNPDMLEKIHQRDVAGVPAELEPLFGNSDVENVARGGSLDSPLSRDTVEKWAQVHA